MKKIRLFLVFILLFGLFSCGTEASTTTSSSLVTSNTQSDSETSSITSTSLTSESIETTTDITKVEPSTSDKTDDITYESITTETTSELTFTETGTELNPEIERITIREANDIAYSLQNKKVTTTYYYVTGTVTKVEPPMITIADPDESIICYSKVTPDLMYPKYQVVLQCQIQNYNGTPELVNYNVARYTPATYSISLMEVENGGLIVDKVSNLSYGETVTIKLFPAEGYYAKSLLVDGVSVGIDNNVSTIKITNDVTIEAKFAKESDIPVPTPGEDFKIYSLEMHGTYGDSTIIKYGDYDILVDSGTYADGQYVNKALNNIVTDGVIDLLIVSHPDSDHYAGIVDGNALNGMRGVENMIVNSHHTTNDKIKSAVKNQFPNVDIKIASDITSSTNKVYTIEVDEYFSIDILYNSLYTGSSKNNSSIPALINYKDTKVFMGGDMEAASCDAFMEIYPNLFNDDDYIIFKGLHHGSNGSNKDNFLKYMKPDLCFVSAPLKPGSNGAPSFSNHPYLDAMTRIGNVTHNVYWAGINGNITITCDGYSSKVSGAGRTIDYSYYRGNNNYELVDRELEKDVNYFSSYWYRTAIEQLNYPDFENII